MLDNSAQPLIIFGAALHPSGKPSPALLARVHTALAYGATRHVVYIVTDGVPRNGRTEAAVMAELLTGAGVPPQQIVMENSATDTFDSVVLCSRILRHMGTSQHTQVAVVTSPYHRPRCLLLLRIAGWQAWSIPFAPPLNHYAPLRTKLRRTLHEALAIPWDALLVLVWRIVPR